MLGLADLILLQRILGSSRSRAYSSAASALAYLNMALVTGGSSVFSVVIDAAPIAALFMRKLAASSWITRSLWPIPNLDLNSAAISSTCRLLGSNLPTPAGPECGI